MGDGRELIMEQTHHLPATAAGGSVGGGGGKRSATAARYAGVDPTNHESNPLTPGKTVPSQPRSAAVEKYTGHCAKSPDDSGCWMTPQQRSAVLRDLDRRLLTACETFRRVITETKIANNLKSKGSVWVMAIEVFYLGAVNAVPAIIAKAMTRTLNIRGGIVRRVGFVGGKNAGAFPKGTFNVPDFSIVEPKFPGAEETAANLTGALDIGMRLARKAGQSKAKSVTGDTARTAFLAGLQGDLAIQADIIANAATNAMNDDQRIALAEYYNPAFHRPERYRQALKQIIDTYKSDVESIGTDGRVLLRVLGPTYDNGGKKTRIERTGLFYTVNDDNNQLRDYPLSKFPVVRRNNLKMMAGVGGLGLHREYYQLINWTTKGFEKLATQKQEDINGTTGLSTIAHDAPWIFDPMSHVPVWIKTAAPKFKPPRVPRDKKAPDMFGGLIK